jgi:hypothetical protein
MLESWLGATINRIVFNRIAIRISPFKDADESEEYFSKLQIDYESQPGLLNISYGLFDAIDNKTGALLTHISLLIAVVAIFYSTLASGWAYKLVLGVEIISYLIATVICLRCIRFDLPQIQGTDTHLKQIYHELTDRRALYTLALDITLITTLFLILTFIFHMLS